MRFGSSPTSVFFNVMYRGSFENSAAKIIRTRADIAQRQGKGTKDVKDSFTKSMYRNPLEIKDEVFKHAPDDFLDAFEMYANPNGNVDISATEDIVKAVMGREVPQWILSKFDKLAREVAVYREVSWPQFR